MGGTEGAAAHSISTRGVREHFLEEAMALVRFMAQHPARAKSALARLESVADSAQVLHLERAKKLCSALRGLLKSVADRKISCTEEVARLAVLTGKELIRAAQDDFARPLPSGDADAGESVRNLVRLCDKASAGEIFDIESPKTSGGKNAPAQEAPQIPDTMVELPLRTLNDLLNLQEEIISMVLKIDSEAERLGASPEANQVKGDVKFLQNEVFRLHDQILDAVRDNPYFIENHGNFHGFFVYAAGQKYFLSAEHIIDVTYENELEYVTEQNRRYMVKTVTDEDGEETKERIPVYPLSSLFPSLAPARKTPFDIVIVAQFMHQKVGMIAEGVQKFSISVKKPLPPSFHGFKMLEGIVFDENYDMIPILSVPEILKRFSAQRGYEAKVFEANTFRRTHQILVVNDSDATRSILKTILTANNFFVDLAKDGIDAIERMKEKQYDLIVTDDDMPRMNGEILIDNIRRMELYQNVPVIAMALNPIPRADAFVSKSDFRRSDLIETAKELLHE